MKLKKATAWYYNKSDKDIVLGDIGITIRSKQSVDLFAVKPTLNYDSYIKSKETGRLKTKSNVLIELSEPPKVKKSTVRKLKVSTEPRASQTKSSYGMDTDKTDYIQLLEEEFPSNPGSMTEAEIWDLERRKMLESLERSDVGEDGEVFDDWLLNEEPDDY